MSDAITGDPVENTGGDPAPKSEGGDAPKTFTQDQVNGFLAKQKREISSQYGDYDQLKADSGELAKIRDGEKTELQKALDRAAEAEKRADKAEFGSLRERIANRPGKVVPAASLTGKTEDELIASADALIAWRDENAPKPAEKPAPKRNPAGSGGGLKSGATGADVDPIDKKELAAKRLRELRGGS